MPLLVHGVGLLYRNFFGGNDGPPSDVFSKVTTAHELQSLTESDKAGRAHRTGIYLTPVTVDADTKDAHFRLLRCSSNLAGPTGAFAAVDEGLVGELNEELGRVMAGSARMNHVLAQAYWNRFEPFSESGSDAMEVESSGGSAHSEPPKEDVRSHMGKSIRAKIRAHSDKTKDMPASGVMAFSTFYEREELVGRLRKGDVRKMRPDAAGALPDARFDWGRNGISGLTRLRFVLKGEGGAAALNSLPRSFDVTLYPDSVFLMPLVANRLYTHAIVPANLDSRRLPTRLGYVVRCSGTECVFKAKEAAVFLKRNEGPMRVLRRLEEPTLAGREAIKALYARENATRERIDYGVARGEFPFSLNCGDYLRPIVQGEAAAPDDVTMSGVADANEVEKATTCQFEFTARPLELRPPGMGNYTDPFSALTQGVHFERFGKGRRCAVLVRPESTSDNQAELVPLVRTTTRYANAAQKFGEAYDALCAAVRRASGFGEGLGGGNKQEVPPALDFNNALAEVYTKEYATMGAHSDQAQDLLEGGVIAVCSFYALPENVDAARPPRKLLVEAKDGSAAFEVPLAHGTVVLFDAGTNARHRHRIVLDAGARGAAEAEWLGVTLRTASTFVRFHEEEDGAVRAIVSRGGEERELELPTAEARRDLLALRRRENAEVDFKWPFTGVTLSPTDLMPPV